MPEMIGSEFAYDAGKNRNACDVAAAGLPDEFENEEQRRSKEASSMSHRSVIRLLVFRGMASTPGPLTQRIIRLGLMFLDLLNLKKRQSVRDVRSTGEELTLRRFGDDEEDKIKR